ncbi:MAG: tetratricopeptide repeat protein [Firmicutes bacterium]|nr:tetratricopeptide repeat protein [Bacillota bacterium]
MKDQKTQKIDWFNYWKGFTLGFVMLAWIIAVFYLRYPLWILLPIIFVYLVINAIIFYSYYLGMVGNYFYFVRQPDKALKYYRKAIAKNTKNATALYNYALEMLHQGNAQEALKYFELSEKYNTKLFYEKNIPIAKSSCYWVMGGEENIRKAIAILEELKDSYQYVNVGAYTSLGYFYLLVGELDKALEYTNIALEDDREHAPAWDNLGQIRFAQGDMKAAEEAFTKALSFRSYMVDSLFYMGVIYERKKDKQKALEYYKRAAECNISALNTVTREQVENKIKALEKAADEKE